MDRAFNSISRTLASKSSDDSLSTFDPTTPQLVTNFDRVHYGARGVLTAGRDAMAPCWDSRTGEVD